MTTERDIRNQIRFAKKEGLQEGMEQGIEKGAEQKAAEIARQMLADSIPAETVAKYTGLSPDDLAKL
ncbi:MAG: hypothetical protein J5771_06830 [Bacteroidales bacterium]|nr:hypothetical protein [Bacteroidales bacterium]